MTKTVPKIDPLDEFMFPDEPAAQPPELKKPPFVPRNQTLPLLDAPIYTETDHIHDRSHWNDSAVLNDRDGINRN